MCSSDLAAAARSAIRACSCASRPTGSRAPIARAPTFCTRRQATPPDIDTGTPHLVLVDGSGFVFRAFHALPPMSRPDGTPVNAVFGFANMLERLLREHVGTHLAVIFDAGRLTFRNRIYDAYKAHRPRRPRSWSRNSRWCARRPRR